MVFFFLALLLAMVVYEGWHLWKIVPGGWPVKLVITGLFVCWFCVFVAGLAFTERFSVRTTVWLSEIGMPWMIAFVYLFLLFALADLALLCRFLPRAILENNAVVCFLYWRITRLFVSLSWDSSQSLPGRAISTTDTRAGRN